jgi:hypothetical protein
MRDRLLQVGSEEGKHLECQKDHNSPSLTAVITDNANGCFAVCLWGNRIEPGRKAAAGQGSKWGLAKRGKVCSSLHSSDSSYKHDDGKFVNNLLRMKPGHQVPEAAGSPVESTKNQPDKDSTLALHLIPYTEFRKRFPNKIQG